MQSTVETLVHRPQRSFSSNRRHMQCRVMPYRHISGKFSMTESEMNTRLAPQRDGEGENALNIYTASETLIKEVCHTLVIVYNF